VFWDLSPRELYREIDIARRVQVDQWNAQIILAWRIEELHLRTQTLKRLPDLQTLLIGHTSMRQTPDEQRRILTHLAEQYDLPLTTPPKAIH
jgi:hypothetical protein